MNAWLDRIHGELTYRATQLLTGHGCFNTFLFRIGKERSPICSFCNIDEDSAEHTLQVCERWSEERDILRREIGPDLRLVTIIGKMCESEEAWNAFLHFAEVVLRIKEEEERLREQQRRNRIEETAEKVHRLIYLMKYLP